MKKVGSCNFFCSNASAIEGLINRDRHYRHPERNMVNGGSDVRRRDAGSSYLKLSRAKPLPGTGIGGTTYGTGYQAPGLPANPLGVKSFELEPELN